MSKQEVDCVAFILLEVVENTQQRKYNEVHALLSIELLKAKFYLTQLALMLNILITGVHSLFTLCKNFHMNRGMGA